MLLTRGACYCLIATKHLAEHAGEGVSSANDLAEIYGLPHQGLAKMLQRLAAAGLLLSHHGTKGGYTLARSARHISVFDVIKASEGPRSGIHAGGTWSLLPGYPPPRMVRQLVEDLLRELTIADIKEQDSSPTDREPHMVSYMNARHLV
jgi:Rrf2 family protein